MGHFGSFRVLVQLESNGRGANNSIFFYRNKKITKKKQIVFLAENTGRAVLGGACAAGVGALCFYGLGLSNDVGAIDKARYVTTF